MKTWFTCTNQNHETSLVYPEMDFSEKYISIDIVLQKILFAMFLNIFIPWTFLKEKSSIWLPKV